MSGTQPPYVLPFTNPLLRQAYIAAQRRGDKAAAIEWLLAQILENQQVGRTVHVSIEEYTPMSVQVGETKGMKVTTTDARGNASRVDGAPQWASSDVSILTVTPSVDGMRADVTGVAEGTATVTVTVDADLSPGVKNVVGSKDVTVDPAETTTVTVDFE